MRSMFVRVPHLSRYGKVLHAFVSVSYVACLLDGVKYVEQPPPRESRDLHRIRQGRAPATPPPRSKAEQVGRE